MTAFIYELLDPRNLEVRYVGKSSKPIARLWQHLHSKLEDEKKAWVDELLALNLKPIMLVTHAVSDDDWKEIEIAQIKKYRDAGLPLINKHKGGGGGDKPNEEQLLARSVRMKELWSNPEFRERLSEIIKVNHRTEDFINQSRARTSQLWESDEYREHVIIGMVESWSSEERRQRQSEQSKDYWREPENKEKTVANIYAAWQNDARRAAQSERNRQRWTDEKQRAKWIEGLRESHRTEEHRVSQSRRMKSRWDDPEARAKLTESIRASRSPDLSQRTIEMNNAAWSDPEERARRCEAMKKSWTPERRVAQAERIRERNKNRAKR